MGAVTVAKYERQVYYGTAGSTASNQVLALIEADVNFASDKDMTTIRNTGTSIPLETQQVVQRKCEIKFKCRNVKSGTGATGVAALLAAALHVSGPIIALKVVSYSGGATLFDGDVNLEVNDPDSRELEFTATPSREGGREPSF